MKILNREEFLKLDGPVLFSKYSPCITGDLCIRYDVINPNDFIYLSLDPVNLLDIDNFECSSDVCFAMQECLGNSATIDTDCYARWGHVPEDEMFMVFESKDVVSVIKKIGECLGVKQ